MIAHLAYADYIIIIIFLTISCSIGIYFAYKDRHNKKIDNAFVGNRKFSMFSIACSLMVTQISAILIQGMPAEFYTRGAQYWVYIIGQWCGVILAIYLFIPVFHLVGSSSSFKYVQYRYNSLTLRIYCSLTFITTQLLYASVVLFAPCLAISLIIPISLNNLLLLIGGVCTFYTSIGGFKTVVVTDLFQFIVIFSVIILLLIKGTIEVGGFTNVFKTAKRLHRLGDTFNFDPNPTVYQSVWNLFLGIFVLTLRAYGVYQPSVQRYVAMPSIKKAQRSTFIVLPMQLLLIFVLSTLGFVMLAAYQSCDPLTLKAINRKDLLLALFAIQSFKSFPGLIGLFLACIFSGSLSTLSSSFNSLAAVCMEDFILPITKRFNTSLCETELECMDTNGLKETSPMQECNQDTTKFSPLLPPLITFVFGCLVIGLSFLAKDLEGILNAALFALSVFGGQMTAVFFVGMFIKSANYKGVMVGKLLADAICLTITIGFFKYAKYIVPPYIPIESATSPYSPYLLNGTGIATKFCEKEWFINQSISTSSAPNSMLTNVPPKTAFFKLSSISYLLVSPIGFAICTITAVVVSLLTGGTESLETRYDPKFLHPWVRGNGE